MIPLYSTKQVREVDGYAINHLGMPGIMLMENASLEIYNAAKEKMISNQLGQILGFVCGKGNNGGDGFATARHFANNGFKIIVIHIGSENEMTEDCKTNYRILKSLSKGNKNILIKKYSSNKELTVLKNCNVIFDSLLGTGIKGELKEPYNSVIKYLNQLKAFKVAIDIPTGLDADTGSTDLCFNVDMTVTLGELKKGLFIQDGYSFGGEVVKGNIGVSPSYFDRFEIEDYLIEPEDANNSLPVKSKSIHKYSAGRVLTIAGSGKLPGAAVLSSTAALKSGAGASILYFPNSVKNLVHKNLEEVVIYPYEDISNEYFSINNINEFKTGLEWSDVLAIGPGLGREVTTQKAIVEIIKNKNPKKIVIDADAIYALSKINYKKLDLRNLILTPHHGEFANLIGIDVKTLQNDLLKYGKKFVSETKSYLVLKGAPTIIFTPNGDALINTTGNAGMAKFGTGDVLTGIIAGFLSQNPDEIEKSLIAAVYLHSLSADLLLQSHTEFGFTAMDIINNLPSAINFIRRSIV